MRISDWSSDVCSSDLWCRAGRDAAGTGRLAGIIRTTVEGIRLMSWELLADPQVWILLLTLSSIDIVLGIDNLVFISIAVSRLPPQQREKARKFGIAVACLTSLALLLKLAYLTHMKQDLLDRKSVG